MYHCFFFQNFRDYSIVFLLELFLTRYLLSVYFVLPLFPLVTFKNFFITRWSNLIMMCLGVVFSCFLCLGFIELLGSVDLQFSLNLEYFQLLFMQIFLLFSLSSSTLSLTLPSLLLSSSSLLPISLFPPLPSDLLGCQVAKNILI